MRSYDSEFSDNKKVTEVTLPSALLLDLDDSGRVLRPGAAFQRRARKSLRAQTAFAAPGRGGLGQPPRTRRKRACERRSCLTRT